MLTKTNKNPTPKTEGRKPPQAEKKQLQNNNHKNHSKQPKENRKVQKNKTLKKRQNHQKPNHPQKPKIPLPKPLKSRCTKGLRHFFC